MIAEKILGEKTDYRTFDEPVPMRPPGDVPWVSSPRVILCLVETQGYGQRRYWLLYIGRNSSFERNGHLRVHGRFYFLSARL